MKRVIQQEMENPLASRILDGEFVDGDMVEIDVDRHQRFTFRKGAGVKEGELVE